MNHDDRRAALAEALAAVRTDPALASFVVRGESLSAGEVRRITLDRQLTERVIGDVLAHGEASLRREFLAYDPSYQLAPNQVIADDLAAVPALEHVMVDVAGADVSTDTSDAEAPVIAMVHRVEGLEPADAITAVRVKGLGIATKRPSGALAMLPNGGVFEEVRDEILWYEPRFDVLVHGSTLVVSTITMLSRQLESPERAEAVARETFARATESVRIEGASALEDAVATDPTMRQKMMALSRLLEADAEYAALLTTDRLVDFVRENPHVGIEVAGDGDEARLVFDASPQLRHRIPKMLADDYLHSTLSSRFYEAGSKQRL